MGRYFPYLPNALKTEWFDYMTNYVLSTTRYGRPDMVLEGWLLTQLPRELKEVIKYSSNLLTVTMRNYAAHAPGAILKANGHDYTEVVAALRTKMRKENERSLMPRVKQQRFEDCVHCAGRSNCLDRLTALCLPPKLSGKRVLDWTCNAGYFATRLYQRGAEVYATDTHDDVVRLAARISTGIYNIPAIRYYRGNLLTSSFAKPVQFDYILLLHTLNGTNNPAAVISRAKELLAPGGTLVVEVNIMQLDSTDPLSARTPIFREIKDKYGSVTWCPNERTILTSAAGLTPVMRKCSTQPLNSTLCRMVYHFKQPVDTTVSLPPREPVSDVCKLDLTGDAA